VWVLLATEAASNDKLLFSAVHRSEMTAEAGPDEAVDETLVEALEEVDEELPSYLFFSTDAHAMERRAYELISGRCYWTGHWCRDYCYHVRNWHPLLSCVMCDRLNPYTKSERWAVLLAMLILSIIPTALLMNQLNSQNCSWFGEKVYVLTLVTLPVLVLQYIIEYIIWFREIFAQHRDSKRFGLLCRCCHMLMICLKRSFLWSSIIASMIFAVVGFFSAKDSKVSAIMVSLVVSRLEFWLIWFATDMFMPCIGFFVWWRKEKVYEEKRQEALKRSRTDPSDDVEPLSRFQWLSGMFPGSCATGFVGRVKRIKALGHGAEDEPGSDSDDGTKAPAPWFAQPAAVLKSKVSDVKSGFSDALSGVQSKFHKKPAADTSLAEPLDPSGSI